MTAERIEQEQVQGLAAEEALVLLSEHIAFELAVRFAVKLDLAMELLELPVELQVRFTVGLADY